ncbi:hypothetical protein R1sor_015867 [Riccia sorocarpa]|uniref:Uncharacterized protein n=1 Tax=Riccia sorocarpa TaxID=122646 RepID=A0ABD3HDT3_9MARC
MGDRRNPYMFSPPENNITVDNDGVNDTRTAPSLIDTTVEEDKNDYGGQTVLKKYGRRAGGEMKFHHYKRIYKNHNGDEIRIVKLDENFRETLLSFCLLSLAAEAQ